MRKYTYEEVKKIFEDNNCILLEKEYFNSKFKNRYICECGREKLITFHCFLRGQRCKECGIKKRSKTQRFSYKYVKDYFEKEGCILLSKEYINCDSPLDYICECKRESVVTFDCFKNRGHRCKECGIKKFAKSKKHSYKYIKECFEKEGCILLSKEYGGNKILLDYICSCKNQSKISYDNFRKGHRCWECGLKKISGKNNYNYKDGLTHKQRMEQRNYEEYSEWRRKVYKRDNYTCKCCNQIGGKLCAHHIESYGSNEELRVDLENGTTLCQGHHKEFHKKYGYGNNTKTQFDEFMIKYSKNT